MKAEHKSASQLFGFDRPFAITMWEFSWIERRWAGAGYEDWDVALTELKERGYDAVRIDAFPHLVAADVKKDWLLKPEWCFQCWGSYSINKINLYDNLTGFLSACRKHGIKVGLSTWFREDIDNVRMNINSPKEHAEIWIKTVDFIKQAGLLDTVIYVDLCNEFPNDWAPFYSRKYGKSRFTDDSYRWMREAVAEFKKAYPDIPVTFSLTTPYPDPNEDLSFLDFLEPHLWMANSCNYYEKVGYNYDRFSHKSYDNLMLYGKEIYLKEKDRYIQCLKDEINRVVEWSVANDKPLITTECWAIVDYKDGPMLDWDWVLELNEIGVREAAKSGRWAGIATSNFCGPQFVGMWRETDWHKRLTDLIHNSKLPE